MLTRQTFGRKKQNMGTKPEDEGLGKTLGFRCRRDDEARIKEIMRKERRKESDVCRALLHRGIAVYERDNELFEPEQSRRVPMINEAPSRKRPPGDQRKTGTGNR